jgi:hypothetical protein
MADKLGATGGAALRAAVARGRGALQAERRSCGKFAQSVATRFRPGARLMVTSALSPFSSRAPSGLCLSVGVRLRSSSMSAGKESECCCDVIRHVGAPQDPPNTPVPASSRPASLRAAAGF